MASPPPGLKNKLSSSDTVFDVHLIIKLMTVVNGLVTMLSTKIIDTIINRNSF